VRKRVETLLRFQKRRPPPHHHHLYEEEEEEEDNNNNNNNIILIMGQTVYHGVAKNVYVAKEALIGLALGVVAGCGWKYSHWQRRGEIERYYEKMPKN